MGYSESAVRIRVRIRFRVRFRVRIRVRIRFKVRFRFRVRVRCVNMVHIGPWPGPEYLGCFINFPMCWPR